MGSSVHKRKAENDGHQPLSPPASKRRIESSTTAKSLGNFFKKASEKEAKPVAWRVMDSLLVAKNGGGNKNAQKAQPPRRIIAFDLDSTLIKTRSGNRFAKDADDWQWWHSIVPAKLKHLFNEGVLVLVMSNQGGISLKNDPKTIKGDKKLLSNFKSRVGSILAALDLPISVYAATERDQYRKPNAGMWQTAVEDYDLDDPGAIDVERSLFVGDAGGRLKDNSGSADFSSSDRDFASNIGIDYLTPEEFFLEEPPRNFQRSFDPSSYVADTEGDRVSPPGQMFTKRFEKELVLMCGSPGSGKSTFYFKHLQPCGYERVNQDILKSRDRCVKQAKEYLALGKSVVVDNTNADRDVRSIWISVAKELGASIRCISFSADAALSEHNDAVRASHAAMNPENRTRLPAIAFSSFKKRYQQPQLSEGFQDISIVDFAFRGTAEERALWQRYY